MQDLLQKVLEDSSARTAEGARIVAGKAAAEFAPWGTGSIE